MLKMLLGFSGLIYIFIYTCTYCLYQWQGSTICCTEDEGIVFYFKTCNVCHHFCRSCGPELQLQPVDASVMLPLDIDLSRKDGSCFMYLHRSSELEGEYECEATISQFQISITVGISDIQCFYDVFTPDFSFQSA